MDMDIFPQIGFIKALKRTVCGTAEYLRFLRPSHSRQMVAGSRPHGLRLIDQLFFQTCICPDKAQERCRHQLWYQWLPADNGVRSRIHGAGVTHPPRPLCISRGCGRSHNRRPKTSHHHVTDVSLQKRQCHCKTDSDRQAARPPHFPSKIGWSSKIPKVLCCCRLGSDRLCSGGGADRPPHQSSDDSGYPGRSSAVLKNPPPSVVLMLNIQ